MRHGDFLRTRTVYQQEELCLLRLNLGRDFFLLGLQVAVGNGCELISRPNGLALLGENLVNEAAHLGVNVGITLRQNRKLARLVEVGPGEEERDEDGSGGECGPLRLGANSGILPKLRKLRGQSRHALLDRVPKDHPQKRAKRQEAQASVLGHEITSRPCHDNVKKPSGIDRGEPAIDQKNSPVPCGDFAAGR